MAHLAEVYFADVFKQGGTQMKLTGELKDKVDQTAKLEDAKDIIAKAGMLLTDDEVCEVTGGVKYWQKVVDYAKKSAPIEEPLNLTLYD